MRERARAIFETHQDTIHRRTDRMFAALMVIQYAAGVAAALFLSPLAWSGAESSIHFHVWMALGLGAMIASLPIALALLQPGRVLTRHVIAAGQMLFAALLIHLTDGRIETHFHIFGSLAFLSFYRDYRVLVTASILVAADHFVRGAWMPQSVYGVLSIEPWRWIEHTGWVLFEDAFLFIAISQSLKDLREIAVRTAMLEENEEKLQEAVRIRDAFVSICSHELKTPLTSLKLQAQLGRKILSGRRSDPRLRDEEVSKLFERTDQQADRLTRLVEEMLDVSRIQNGKLEIRRSDVDLSKVVSEVVEVFSPQLEEAGCRLSVNVDRNVKGYWDSQRIEQILINLLGNALKYAPGTPVSIRVSEEAGRAVIRVKDEGPGIPRDKQSKIFQRFERATDSKSISGLGLGLYITRTIVEQHLGTIRVESDPGKGCEFIVELPKSPVEGQACIDAARGAQVSEPASLRP